MEALALGLHESSLDGFYHLCRTLCVKDIALYDAFDEAFLAYFKDVHADALQLTEELRGWLADPRALEGLTDEQRAGAGSARPRGAARAVRAAPARAEGAPRRRQPLDRHRRHVAVRHRRPEPDRDARRRRGRAQRDGGRRRAPVPRVPPRRRARRPPDRRRAARAAPARPRGRAGGARPRRDHRRDVPQRGRARDRVPAAAAQPRQGRAADGRRRLDGSARRAGEPAVHRGVALGAVREVPQLLLPQLRLQRGLRGRAVPAGRCRSADLLATATATRSSSSSATR